MAERAVVFAQRLDLILEVFSNLNHSLKAHGLDEMSPGWPGRAGSRDGRDGRGGSRDRRAGMTEMAGEEYGPAVQGAGLPRTVHSAAAKLLIFPSSR